MVFYRGGRRQHDGPIERGTRLVGTQHVADLERMRHRLQVGQVQRLDVRCVLEHRRQLLGEEVELRLGELEARQPRDVGDLRSFKLAHERSGGTAAVMPERTR